jgi:DNA-binding MarR family transcriptional regulator
MSQALVAFTVEFDNEFERRMGESGNPGARLSLVVWSNLMRFLAEGGMSVRDLAARALAPQERIKFQLGCLERWGFIVLQPNSANDRTNATYTHRRGGRDVRVGWGSGRGIRADSLVRLTSLGLKAVEVWKPLLGQIEKRWRARFGDREIRRLRESLRAVADQFDMELPHGLPALVNGTEAEAYPSRTTQGVGPLCLPALLSQLLLAFALEFDRASKAPLALSSNPLRILGDKPVRAADIPLLTGCSPETSGVGWQIKPYVVIEADRTAKRGKTLRLTPLGLQAQQTYRRLVREIEARWEPRFGRDEVRNLRASLQDLLEQRDGDRLRLSAGLVPPQGVARAGYQAPALGRKSVGPAARQRMRDLVAQTQAFVRDPLGALPHYPLWDANRGFGP